MVSTNASWKQALTSAQGGQRTSFSGHLRGTAWVVLAADLSHVDEEEELGKTADSLVLQFTSDSEFDIPGMMQELDALHPDSADWRLKEVFTEEQHPGIPGGGPRR